MGHSTGCQDVIHYLTKTLYKENIPETSQVQGGILQAPVSDLEALLSGRNPTKHEALVQRVYDEYISKGKRVRFYLKSIVNLPGVYLHLLTDSICWLVRER